MMSKKIIIIVSVVLGIAVLAVYSAIQVKKTSQQTISESSNESQNIPNLPEDQIAESSDPNMIQKSIEDNLQNTKSAGKQLSENKYRDSSGKSISISDFSAASKIHIPENVMENTSQKDYATFSCAKEKEGRPSIGIMIQLRRDVDPREYQQSYVEMEKDMKIWEKNIFRDLSPLFFPAESFKEEPIFGVTKYATSNNVNIVEIRFANLGADSGKQYSLDWGFLNDQIFISNDKDCLRREFDQSADAYES